MCLQAAHVLRAGRRHHEADGACIRGGASVVKNVGVECGGGHGLLLARRVSSLVLKPIIGPGSEPRQGRGYLAVGYGRTRAARQAYPPTDGRAREVLWRCLK